MQLYSIKFIKIVNKFIDMQYSENIKCLYAVIVTENV